MNTEQPFTKLGKYKEHKNCRVCGSPLTHTYIDLGYLPLSNNLCDSPIENAERYPLKVMLCYDCGLSQLSIVIDPNVLFGHYVYRSGISAGYVKHCRDMAKDLKVKYNLTEESFMIDIAGNDGTLLSEFKDEIGLKILNVDPAVNLGAICQAKGVPTLTEFWSTQTAKKIINAGWKADLITATNVFAHVDDVYDFMEGANMVLKKDGILVLEFPYLMDFIDNNEFDTIYFEHLSYFSIRPLMRLCVKLGLHITGIEKQAIHGGSVRVHISKGANSYKDNTVLWREYSIGLDTYKKFADTSFETIKNFRDGLHKLKSDNKKIAGFAASAKGNTLLNCAGITCGTMSYIVDQTPEKIGRYSPGTHIPIVSMMELQTHKPDYLVILSWNFKDEIIEKCRQSGYSGKFIIPIPEFKIID